MTLRKPLHLIASVLLSGLLSTACFMQASAQEIRFRHVTLLAKDASRLADWYVDKLGFRIDRRFELTRWDGSKVIVIQVNIGDTAINITQRSGVLDREPNKELYGYRHIALWVTDVDAMTTKLKAQGVEFVVEPNSPPGQIRMRLSHLRDAEGNVVELYNEPS